MFCRSCDKPISEGSLCEECIDIMNGYTMMENSDILYEEKMENWAHDGSPVGPWREPDEDSL